MYCNFSKIHVFPLVFRASCHSKCFKHFSNGFCWGVSQNSRGAKSRIFSIGNHHGPSCDSYGSKPRNFPSGFSLESLERCGGMKRRNFSSNFQLKSSENIGLVRAKRFSDGSRLTEMDNGGGVRPRKALPWIASYRSREAKGSGKPAPVKTNSSSWEESASVYFSKTSTSPSSENKESSANILKRNRESSSSWEDSANIYLSKTSSKPSPGSAERRTIDVPSFKEDVDEEVEEDAEPVDDPRWDKIKRNFRKITVSRSNKPESRRWDKQESWGRKTWKEATESTVPKLIGEGVYGVGPVLAALTVGKREFYTLYVQEGLDFSNNNRKKKDKKGFEKVLKRAEKMGLTVKETSKHDLNMVADNRPHQGVVLDASSLEMDCISELEAVPSDKEDKSTVWVALDEVTDPQNLGAIVRSAYFFGAAGLVLCAKNSAPLSGVVSKASAGSLELIELRYCKNMMQFLTKSIENGWRVLGGSVSSRALPLNEVAAAAPTILVLGSEGSGLRPLVEKSCTQLIRIPGNIPFSAPARGIEGEEVTETGDNHSTEEFRSFMAVESLNVSVAAGVLLYHLVGNSKCSTDDKQIDTLD